MMKLSSLYKKSKNISDTAAPLDTDTIVQGFLNLIPKVGVFATNSRIFAKESMNMPMMARDANLTRQNIIKLVKLQGDSPVNKADSFFERASEREKLYESTFTKESKQLKSKSLTTEKPSSFAKNTLSAGATALGIAGFIGAIALAGKAISAIPGGITGMKDMLFALAEGLGAFSLKSFAMFSGLLAAGGLFGSMSGITSKTGAVLGITAVGLGIGLFFSGLAAGGAIGDMIGNSAGIRDMMVNLAEGLSAFSGESFGQFAGLLAVGGIFGAVTSLAGLKTSLSMMGGAVLGLGAIGAGIGMFFSGLAAGGALGGAFTENPTMIKDLLTNIAGGLNALSELDAGSLAKVTLVLPLFGASMLSFLSLQGLGGVVQSLGSGVKGLIDFIFGTKEKKSPLEQTVDDLKKLGTVNPDVVKVGQGFFDMMKGLDIISSLSDRELTRALRNGNLILTLAEKMSKGKTVTPAPATPRGFDGRKSDDPRRVDIGSSEVTVQMGPNGAFATKNDFLLRMYPLAVQASKDLGGVDPNALLTQWGFESAWGKKVSGDFNYFGIKADSSWKGESVSKTTTEYIRGEKKVLPQSFRSYSSPEEAVADYVGFLKKNKRYQKAGLFETKTSAEYFDALQRAGYATDPNYAKKLTEATQKTTSDVAKLTSMPQEPRQVPAPTTQVARVQDAPSVGKAIASASSDINYGVTKMNLVPPTVVVNAPTQQPQTQQNDDAESVTRIASPLDFEFADAVFGAPDYA